MKTFNIAIIGGGVIGTAIAREISAAVKDVVLLEKMPRPGMMTSTRNSGVLHGGIYYPSGSLKSRFALPGNYLTREFCTQQCVAFRNCGKLIIADSEADIPQLENLEARGSANGVPGLRIVGRDYIRKREPNIVAAAALEVPTSCVVDGPSLIKAYARVAQEQGATVLTESSVMSLEENGETIRIGIERGDPAQPGSLARESLSARCVINAAGLYADEIAALLDGVQKYHIYPVRGEYVRIRNAKASLINGLVYPLPHNDVMVRDATSRKIHFIPTIQGDLLIGPTARFVDSKEDYDNDRLSVEDFYDALRPMLPKVELSDLELAHSGIRPQLIPPGRPGKSDYIIERSEVSPRLINLIGMETPGLTAAPAVAQYIGEMARETLD